MCMDGIIVLKITKISLALEPTFSGGTSSCLQVLPLRVSRHVTKVPRKENCERFFHGRPPRNRAFVCLNFVLSTPTLTLGSATGTLASIIQGEAWKVLGFGAALSGCQGLFCHLMTKPVEHRGAIPAEAPYTSQSPGNLPADRNHVNDLR